MRIISFVALTALVFVVGCAKVSSPTANVNSQNSNAVVKTQPSAEPSSSKVEPGALQPGQASGSYTAKGETVVLKYAYAGRGKRFGNDSTIILLTDSPIPPDEVAKEIESQTLLLAEKIRGLEYVIDQNGYWVRYHPSQYQESKSHPLSDFSVQGDTIRGADEDKGELTDGRYSRSVKFVATMVK